MSPREGSSLEILKPVPTSAKRRRVWVYFALLILALALLATWRLIALGEVKIAFETSTHFCRDCAVKREETRFEFLGLTTHRFHDEPTSVSHLLGVQSSCTHPEESYKWFHASEYSRRLEWDFQTGDYKFEKTERKGSLIELEKNGLLREVFAILLSKNPETAREKWRAICSSHDPLTGMPLDIFWDFDGTAADLAHFLENFRKEDALTGQPLPSSADDPGK